MTRPLKVREKLRIRFLGLKVDRETVYEEREEEPKKASQS